MSYGLQTFNAAGAVTFDSTLAVGFLPIGLYEVALGAPGFVKTWPGYPGRTVFIVDSDGFGYSHEGVTVDSALGYPRITVASSTISQRIFLVVLL